MKGSSKDARLLFFPSLHPVLAEGTPHGVRFLDPGLADPEGSAWLLPEGLPLDQTHLAGFVHEFDKLRREVKNPKDLAMLAAMPGGHFFSDTSFSVREELADQMNPERVAVRRATSAQLFLCLAYMLEESLLDLAGAGALDRKVRQGLAESLGFEGDFDDDDDAAGALAAALAGTGMPSAASFADEFRPSWRQVLSPFWAIAPGEAGLFVADPDIIATWAEAGLSLADPTEAELSSWFPDGPPSENLRVGRETGWRLLGKSRPNPEAPWLDQPRTLVLVQS